MLLLYHLEIKNLLQVLEMATPAQFKWPEYYPERKARN